MDAPSACKDLNCQAVCMQFYSGEVFGLSFDMQMLYLKLLKHSCLRLPTIKRLSQPLHGHRETGLPCSTIQRKRSVNQNWELEKTVVKERPPLRFCTTSNQKLVENFCELVYLSTWQNTNNIEASGEWNVVKEL